MFSNQIPGPVTALDQLPAHCVQGYAQWRPTASVPAGTATYFIGNDGQPTALLHTPVACSPCDALCEAESSAAAESDLQVAL